MADAATAVRKLQSRQPLTNDEKKILGISVTPENAGVSPITGPTWQQIADEKAATATADAARAAAGPARDISAAAEAKRIADAATKTTPVVPQDNSDRQSAYDLLFEEFKRYGLESLVTPLKDLISDPNISEGEFSLKLRASKPYTDRFKANEGRLGKGLRALSEAEYIRLEDQYQNVMRNYGMPASYYAKGELGRQEALEKFIAADVSPTELEDRIMTAQDRVINANPEVLDALKLYYGDSISNGDILAYALNPEQGLKDIQRKVTAAEIGGAAMAQKLGTSVSRAEELARYGVTKEQAQKGFETVAGVAPRGGQLAAIYGEDPYTQATAETEVFGLGGSAEAKRKREKLSALETSAFSGQSGLTQGALSRDRAGAF